MQAIVTSKDIVVTARSWIGTRFHHQGRVKATIGEKGGCDCIGLVVGVMQELGIKGKDGQYLYMFDQQDYSMLPDGSKLQEALTKHLEEVGNEIQPGDIGLFRFDKNPQHVGFFADYHAGGLSLIHCYRQVRQVVEHRFDEYWRERLVGVFRGVGTEELYIPIHPIKI